MIWLQLIFILSLVIAITCVAITCVAESDKVGVAAVVTFVVCVIILVGIAAVGLLNVGLRSHAETVCERKAAQYERDTRFIRLSSFSWDCITPTSDGWVSIDKVIKTEGSES